MKIALVFPNQLFEQHPAFESSIDQILLIEDSLFFGDWNYPARFHKQKLWLHRATMKRYQASLSQSYPVTYIDYDSQPQALEKQLKASLPKKRARW